ncbi:Ubiquitin-conjugating enzyme E2 6 [Coemansia sp. RSA 2611]|uniref:Ubiquitin-conjugating enzyme E2 6 n=2 Tax=Coemansia TaxID=4863 RepID=A0A9W8L5P1_9FUNG|nr:Ubiquitin-conjugating enzyme E2 6 [Coemansia sp. RSA 2675]KAJ2013074.1 Ubiquitin-conjugating enzyme E2 6 [Coemansia sp. S85]KAJ2377539.1 Ubiquitin-conjugating enzyme E2 6 [Coemansia sp. RSA 2611]KAJ2412337.1 Ubiquitin-conjugating enzyme E2 6 [Coemansia sp. RSA 2530]KAJ2689794.1 Ubiquitin-conjugating enzyme E2 6 [Coemansia spiralis]KAJ2701452.1 Ubiquitin-conjugating enzyme E2 6 [Coemansia sp. IMI 209128]KAJ2780616.1 Ubiquitin-conjugating enzyme E2 6 [Coemansia linderi]
MASKAASKRLAKEYLMIQKSPPDLIVAKPLDKDILEWHYIMTGPPDTPYVGGEYHGKLKFPKDYPFAPPAIQMITPNGRFEVHKDICTSMSNYHPQSWNPGWSVATILTGLLSMMTGDENTTGSVVTSDQQKREYARVSKEYNRANVSFKNAFGNDM